MIANGEHRITHDAPVRRELSHVAIERRIDGLQTQCAREDSDAARARAMQLPERGYLEHEHGLDTRACSTACRWW